MFIRILILGCLCSYLVTPSKASSPWDLVNQETKDQLMGTLNDMCNSVIDYSPDWLGQVPINKRLRDAPPLPPTIIHLDLLSDFVNIALLNQDNLAKCKWDNVAAFFMLEHKKMRGSEFSELNEDTVNLFISMLINLNFIALVGKNPVRYQIAQQSALSEAFAAFNGNGGIKPPTVVIRDNFATPEKPIKRSKAHNNRQ